MTSRWYWLPCLLLLLTLTARRAAAADENKVESKEFPTAATVNGQPIYIAEIDNMMATAQRQRKLDPRVLDRARAEALRQLIERRILAIAFLRDGKYVTDAEIDKELNKFRNQANARGMSLERFAERGQFTVDTLKYDMAYQLGSQKYLDQHLGEALEGYFRDHHREFDGTELRASHILLRPDRFNESEAEVQQRATALRSAILEGKISFEDAAKKYSVGPSREQGGDVGYFTRYGMMQDEFAKTAFGLEKDEISQPVITPFGLHLIRTTDAKPGQRQWTEAVEQLKAPASADLFAKLLKTEEAGAKVEFTGQAPYFKSGTRDLVVPEKKPTP